ncbi:LVIVD repeat-containing protein [Acidobacteriota bacterium]
MNPLKPRLSSRPVSLSALVSLIVMLAALPAAGQSCPELMGQWPYGPALAVAMEGNILYYGTGAAVIALDISNPSSPLILSEITMPDAVNDLALSGSYLYVAADAAGLRIVDVSDPAAPIETGHADVPIAALLVAVSYPLAFVAQTSNVRIIDISDPLFPQEVSSLDGPFLAFVSDIDASGANLFLTIWDGRDSYRGFLIFDCSDPPNPQEVGYMVTDSKTMSAAIAGNYAYVSQTSGPFSRPQIWIFDISDPANPTEAGIYLYDWSAHELTVSGTNLYYLDEILGTINILDISTPTAPVEIGSAPAYGRQMAVSGPLAGIAVLNEGLRILDVSDPTAPFEVVSVVSEGEGSDLAVSEPLAFMAGSNGLRIIDCTDKTLPFQVGSLPSGFAVAAADPYAYVNDSQGFTVYDISDPTLPLELGSALIGDFRRLAVSGRYAYASHTGDGMSIFNISDPTQPYRERLELSDRWAKGFEVSGSHAYVAGEDGLWIYDISSPGNLVATVDINDGALDVTVSDGVAFLTGRWRAGLRIIDVSSPSSPFEIRFVNMDIINEVAAAGSYVFVSDEVFDDSNYGRYVLRVLDATNPLRPVDITAVTTPDIEKMEISGPYLYLAHWRAGMSIYDISGCCSSAPDAVTLLSPDDNALSQPGTLRLEWSDSPAAFYDVFLDMIDPPATLIASDLPRSGLTVALQPATTYYWQVTARNACGTALSATRRFTTYTDNIYRFESKIALSLHTPTDTFPASSLPWSDPDNVLDPSAPPLLFYDVSFRFDPVGIVKEGTTIRIDAI